MALEQRYRRYPKGKNRQRDPVKGSVQAIGSICLVGAWRAWEEFSGASDNKPCRPQLIKLMKFVPDGGVLLLRRIEKKIHEKKHFQSSLCLGTLHGFRNSAKPGCARSI